MSSSSFSNLVARYSGPPASALNNADQGKGCVPFDPLADPPYNYVPSLAAGIIFVVFFTASLIGHIVQTGLSRRWWYSAFALGALCELMGWAARLASHYCPYNSDAFTLQISILIIGERTHYSINLNGD